MSNEYLTLTEIGKFFGVGRRRVGQWLVAIGLRTVGLKPSPSAFAGGFVTQVPSTQPGTYFYVWHGQKTRQALLEAGYKLTDVEADLPALGSEEWLRSDG